MKQEDLQDYQVNYERQGMQPSVTPFWICTGISAGIGILLGVIMLLSMEVFKNRAFRPFESFRSESTEQVTYSDEDTTMMVSAAEAVDTALVTDSYSKDSDYGY